MYYSYLPYVFGETAEQTVIPYEGRVFYVTVVSGSQVAYLLGPYSLQGEAIEQIAKAKQLAGQRDPWAIHYSYGTASLPSDVTVKTLFGK